MQGLVVFKVDDEDWTLDLREGQGSVTKGLPKEKADLTLTINDENFAKLVMGKLNPQQVCRWLWLPLISIWVGSPAVHLDMHRWSSALLCFQHLPVCIAQEGEARLVMYVMTHVWAVHWVHSMQCKVVTDCKYLHVWCTGVPFEEVEDFWQYGSSTQTATHLGRSSSPGKAVTGTMDNTSKAQRGYIHSLVHQCTKCNTFGLLSGALVFWYAPARPNLLLCSII